MIKENSMTVHFPNAVGTEADVSLIRELYAEALALDACGLFEKAKPYYNVCMSMILSKKITFNKESA